jgi:O-succinylbenzoic acid--CoA ligase
LDTLECIFALLELGRPFLPVHPRLTAIEREQLLSGLPISWAIKALPGGQHELERRQPSENERANRLLCSTPQLAALATSGTSGSARVALLSRRAFLAAAEASAKNLGWHAADRWLLCLPLAHIGGLSVVTRCLLARRPIVLAERGPGISSVQRLASAVSQGLPTLMSLVPTQVHGLLELEPRFHMPERVRAILTGGAAASHQLLAACAERSWPVLTSYGLTEACSQVATQRLGTTNLGELGAGRPLPGVRVRLHAGVIHVAGPTLLSGYLGNVSDPALDATGELQTRDLGRFDVDGNLHVLGRVDDLIISGGENIAPWEVEAVLEGCPGVLEACVFGVPDARWGEAVTAALRVHPGDVDQLLASVERECQRRLASFKRPRFYACTSQFVHGLTGKLDRRATAEALRGQMRADLEIKDVR